MMVYNLRGSFASNRRSSRAQAMAVLLAVAASGYAAGAFVHGSPAPSNGSALALPMGTPELRPVDVAALLTPVQGRDESHAEWMETPRECDLESGIAAACIFMD